MGYSRQRINGSFAALSLLMVMTVTTLGIGGCRDENDTATQTVKTDTKAATVATNTTTSAPEPAGLVLDPGLQSASGTPTPADMQALIALQAKVPYPLIVPTYMPAGYQLDAALTSYGVPGTADPAGYYTFRYYQPGNDILNMTFNQSQANSKPLSGYYLTEVNINGQPYQVYWHKTREYLPAGDPVRTDEVGDAEAFVVLWQGQYTDSAGNVQTLYYGLTTSTYTGINWATMQEIISGLKPLSAVGG